MDQYFLTIFTLCVLTSFAGASCLIRDDTRCPVKSPLIFGGRIQPLDEDDPLWNYGRRRFVFQMPPNKSHKRFGGKGSRGVIRIGRKGCPGSSEETTICPSSINYSNLPCRPPVYFPCLTRDSLTISNITSSGFHVQWQRPLPILRSPLPDDGSIIQIGEVGGEIRQVTTTGVASSYEFDDLQPGTTYEVGLVPTDGSEIDPLNLLTVTTLCGVPSLPSLSLGEASSRNATINVQIPPTQDWKCSSIDLVVQSHIGGNWVDLMTLDPSQTEFEVDNLIPCSPYEYRVQLSNTHETVFSDVLIFRAEAEGLTAVENLIVSSDASHRGKLNVSWSPPDTADNACSVSRYKVQYSLMKHKACPFDEESFYYHLDHVNDIEVTLENLDDYSDYNVIVIPVVSKIGQQGSIEGEPTTITGSTLSNYPTEAPSDVLLTGVSQSSLTFSWKPPRECRNQNGEIVEFHYKLKNDDGEEVRSGTTDKTSVTIVNLEPNTMYHFLVSASTSVGPGPYTEPVSEETRYRTPSCPGGSPLRFGGELRRIREAVGSPPWGTGQPIFIIPHHLKNPFRRGGGVVKVWFGQSRNCGGSVPCQRITEDIQQDQPSMCRVEEGESDSSKCDAACPRFSESTPVYSTESLDVSSLKLTWRDWDVTVDRGIGKVTGYLLRHGKVGEPQAEIQKGLSLHHLFTNLAINTDYSIEVIGLTGTSTTGRKLCDGSLSFRFNHTTGCGELRPVQNLTVSNDGGPQTLHVSWDAPDGLCPVHSYIVNYPFLGYKACDDNLISTFLESTETINGTEIDLFVYDDYAEYNISVTPLTESLDGSGLMNGTTSSVIGVTQETNPLMPPGNLVAMSDTPNSVEIQWSRPYCELMNGNFTMFSYTLFQEGETYDGNTQDTNVRIDDLIAYADFTVTVTAHNTAGPGPPAQDMDRTLQSDELSYNPGVTVVSLTEATASSLAVAWPEWTKDIGQGRGTVQSYLLWYGEQGLESDFEFVEKNLMYRAENLYPDTEYYFQVEIIGRGPFGGIRGDLSERGTFRTRCAVPVAPTLSLLVDKVTSFSAVFEYVFPADDPDIFKCREGAVYLQKQNANGEWVDDQELPTTSQYANVYDLRPCSDYRYRIKVVNTHESSVSNTIDVATNVDSIGSVVDLQVTTPDEDGKLLVTWNPPESDNDCAVFAYAVTVDFIGVASCAENLLTQNGSYIVNTTSKMLENLASYSRYFIRVKALLNYGGDDVEWAEVIGTTKASSPRGVVWPTLRENSTSENSLTFDWQPYRLPCQDQMGPNFGYECELFELNTGVSVSAGVQFVTDERCTFTNLKACGKYSCKVRPVNDLYKGNLSQPVNGSISSAALGAIYNITTMPLANGNVMVHWLPPDNSSNLCPATRFKLNYTLQRHQACRVCLDLPQTPLTTNDTIFVMKNLSPFTTYKLNIAVDMEDQEAEVAGTDKIFTTKFAAPSTRPVVLPIRSQRTQTSLGFRWSYPNCSALNGIFKQYTVGGTCLKGETGISNKRTHTYVIHDLKPCTNYSFTVRYVNSISRGPLGVAFDKTLNAKPGRDCKLTLEPLPTGELQASWQLSEENNCEVDIYKITLEHVGGYECEDFTDFGVYQQLLPKSDRNYTFSLSDLPLMGREEYQVTLRAINSEGESDPDAARAVTDILAPSASPSSIIPLMVTSTTAIIYWTDVPCPQRNGEITGYDYKVTKNQETVAEGVIEDKQISLKNLTPSTTYHFKVRGKNSKGDGPFTEEYPFSTSA